MKKTITLFLFMIFSVISYSQTCHIIGSEHIHCSCDSCTCTNCGTNENASKYTKFRPYVSVGNGISNKIYGASFEAGIWNNSVWIAGVYEYFFLKADSVQKAEGYDNVFTGIKLYGKIASVKKISLFLYSATKIGIRTKTLCFEPGYSLIYNHTENIALQWSSSLAFYENSPNTNFCSSISLNYFF